MQTTLIGNPAPAFDLPCTRFPDPDRGRARLSDSSGRWLILVFYPRDFSMVCPTELIGLSQRHEELAELNCDLLAIGCDPVDLHERWMATPKAQGGLGGLNFPLASDPDGEVSRAYGVYQSRENVAVRGTFIIDPEGLIQYQVVHSLSVGRRSQEVIRVLTALQSGGLCREDWMSDSSHIDPYAALRPGHIFSHYLIDSEIGVGTFARVYLARDLQLDRPVALKIFRKDCPVTPSTVLAEARSAAALNHPNVSTIYAVDDTAGLPIIAMEFVDGLSLAQVARARTLASDGLLDVSRQIAAGMAAAHDAGIVHGDLKPENIMLSEDGFVKILDFGLARRLHRIQAMKTDETTELGIAESGDGLFGTPRYLAPEQTRGEPASFASDVFSLGIVFYELTTGKTAFADGNILRVLDQIRNLDRHAMASEAGEPFTGLLQSMLTPDPGDRTITMRQIVNEIDAVCESV
ncbi:protein kinase domain-containing protein [Paludisphaera borealis]|uniref:Serine/threonine-protein kinase PknB n=1 Tax=Paludisphaera borealis TaxID=1387353 RepID=A0A1U7CVF4_9BACT|nr:redoxin domain-containing protein [Paludisphaera borealis]APW62901.1 Serine/threonine-protein kinase PknB [Paludisphaera borealis]